MGDATAPLDPAELDRIARSWADLRARNWVEARTAIREARRDVATLLEEVRRLRGLDEIPARAPQELPRRGNDFPDTDPTAWLYADTLRRILGLLDAANAATQPSDRTPGDGLELVPLRLGFSDVAVWRAEPAVEGAVELLGWVHQIDADAFVFIPASAVREELR